MSNAVLERVIDWDLLEVDEPELVDDDPELALSEVKSLGPNEGFLHQFLQEVSINDDYVGMQNVLLKAWQRDHRFNPLVTFEDNGSVSIWLEELALDANGSDLTSAQDAMVREVLDYASEWAEYLRDAPNHSQNESLALLVLADPSPKRIHQLLFGA